MRLISAGCMRGLFSSLTAAVLLAACAAEDVASEPTESVPGVTDSGDSPDPTESGDMSEDPTLEVVGGRPSAACGWPSTVDVNGCTATLIHPRVVTTAAHCMRGSSGKVTFTAGKGVPGAFSVTGRCRVGATGSSGGGTGRDWAYCVLPDDARIKRMPITPPLVGCEAERFLKPGASAWVVGFGTTGRSGQGYGVKREVEVKVNRLGNGTIYVGDKNVGACHGDSGGPVYMRVGDGTHDWGWRVVGSTSGAGAPNCDCTCATVYVNIAQHVKAIEANEGIDVTPCTDANGRWAPTAACANFPSAPQAGKGTYPACTVTTTRDPIESCGPNPLAQKPATGTTPRTTRDAGVL